MSDLGRRHIRSLKLAVDMTEPQERFLSSTKPYTFFIAGRASGKTTAAILRMISLPWNSDIFCIAPTYTLLRDVLKRALRDMDKTIRDQSGIGLIKGERKAEHDVILVNGSVIHFRSADDYEKLRGLSISYLFVDEAAVIRKEAWEVLAATLREGDCRLWLTTTPKGRQNWVYDTIQALPDRIELIKAPTTSNPFLPESFYETIKRQYATSFALQELEGEFVDGAALVKHEWLKKIDPDRIPNEGLVILSIDPAIVLSEGADYTAFTVLRFHDGFYYVTRTLRCRTTIQQTVELTREIYKAEKCDVLCVEDFSFQKALVEALNSTGLFAYSIKPTRDKVARFMPLLDKFERGVVLLSSALDDCFFDELCSFPNAPHDDQVDSLVYAVHMADQMMGCEVSVIARR